MSEQTKKYGMRFNITDIFCIFASNIRERYMARFEIHDQMGMMDLIQEIGFLPLLDSGIRGFSTSSVKTGTIL